MIPGIAALLVVFILMLIPDLADIGETLEWIFYIFLPNFCFAYSLQEIYTNYQTKNMCKSLVGGQYQNISIESFCSAIDGVQHVHYCCPGMLNSIKRSKFAFKCEFPVRLMLLEIPMFFVKLFLFFFLVSKLSRIVQYSSVLLVFLIVHVACTCRQKILTFLHAFNS